MPKYKFGDLVFNITEKRSPVDGDEELYIGLEHLDSGSLRVTRWGSKVALKGDKLKMQKGDILFGRRNTYLRRVSIAPHDGLFSAHGMIFRARPECMDEDYLPFFIASDYFMDEAIRISVGSLSPTVNWKELKELEFEVPDLESQRETAKVLLAANDLKEEYEELLALTDDLVKSQFIEMFGDPVENEKEWPLVRLDELAEIKIGPFGSLLHKEDYIENGHALVNPSHIVDSKIVIDPKLTISDEKYDELSSYALRIGDVILGRRGEMGRCAVVYEEGLVCGTGSMIIRPGTEMKPYFLQNIISSPAYRRVIEGKAVGVTMMNLNAPTVSSFMIPKLPVKLQEEYLEFVNQSDKSKLAALQASKFLRKGIDYNYNHDFRRMKNVH